jgi:hypothetical protein
MRTVVRSGWRGEVLRREESAGSNLSEAFFLRLGREGYRVVHQACQNIAVYLAQEIAKLGPFRIIYAGRRCLPAVCWAL